MKKPLLIYSGAVLAPLLFAVIAANGWKPALFIMMASIGAFVTTGSVMGVSGKLVVQHSFDQRHALENRSARAIGQ